MRSRSSSPERRSKRALPERILVGRVVRPHGVRGELKVEIHSDNPERFEPGSELIVTVSERPARKAQVASFRSVRGGGLLQVEGCATRDQAEELRGARLEVDRADVPQAPPGFYYLYELVGCRCFTSEDGQIGEVVEVLEDGGGHLLSLRREGREFLVPFVRDFLVSVDTEEGRIDLRLPPGLLEICGSES